MSNIELLAPAGSLESFKCAVYNGADAVYLGLDNFNARHKAENFNKDNIKDIVDFAHLHDTKVYLTVNTLIKDEEVEDFLDMIRVAVLARVDAFIIQDFGMAKLLLSKFKGIVLHASTQMGIHNLQGAKELEKLGFKRVVLSRETKLEDIKLISNNTNLEIEYFVQGALCVAFSGNCYMSAIKNGNSGNRGKCLQLCRLPYKVYNENKLIGEGYYLSPKDLCLMSQIDELITAGVTSFKIEGRLKRASYVAQTVRSWKKVLQAYYSRDNINISSEQKKIQEIFSRGQFNHEAYLYNNDNIINCKLNNHEGRLIGKVNKVERFKDIYKITLELTEEIGEGDAIRLINGTNIISIGVGNVNKLCRDKYDIFSTQKPMVASSVYLLKSVRNERNLTDFEPKLPIDMCFTAKIGRKTVLQAKFNDVVVEVCSEDVVAKAIAKPVTHEDVYKQVSKLNDTIYTLNLLNCEIDEVFIPVSVLNDLRRRVVARLNEERLAIYNNSQPQVCETRDIIVKPILNTPKQEFVLINNVRQLETFKATNVIIEPTLWKKDYVTKLIDGVLKQGVDKDNVYLDLPIVTTTQELEKVIEVLNSIKVGVIINNYSQLNLCKRFKAIAGLGMNVYNSFTADALIKSGIVNYVHSIELNGFSKTSGVTYKEGNPILMTLCHCPIKTCLKGSCESCKFTTNLTYEDDKRNKYGLRRVKIDNCYFQLISEEKYKRKETYGYLIDVRK